MMIRDCKHLIELQHIHMEQTHLKKAKENDGNEKISINKKRIYE